MKKLILPLSLVLSLLVIFVGGIIVAESVTSNRNDVIENKVPLIAVVKEFFPDYKSFKEESGKELKAIDNNNYVKTFYNVYDKKDVEIGNLFVIVTEGFKPDFNIWVAIDSINRKVLGYKEIPYKYNETWLNKLTIEFKDQFKGADITQGIFEFSPLSTASPQNLPNRSSKAIIQAVKLAREQFYQNIGEPLPISFKVTSFTQSFDEFDLFTYHFETKDDTFNIIYRYNFIDELSFVNSSIDLSTEELDICLMLAKKVLPKTFVTKVEGNVISVTGKGYAGNMEADITIDASNKITSFIVTKESESYNDEYNSRYTGPDPFTVGIPNLVEHQNDNNYIQSYNITGATRTTTGLKEMFTYVLKYIKEAE